MLDELKPFIEQFEFEIEEDIDENFSAWNDNADSSNEFKTTQTFDEATF
jgi:hypothetical protein